MLNRRILRIKAFKAVYSLAENPDIELRELEGQLERSCEATRDLYLFLLSIVGPLTQEAASRLEAARNKFNPSEEERNPNMKFAQNRLAPMLAEDPDFVKILSKKKLSWDQCDVLLRHLYDTIRERDYFKAYMESEESSLKEDAALWADIFASEFDDNEELAPILEDISIWWNDDLEYALNWCCRTCESLGKGEPWKLLPLYMDEITGKGESDRAFVRKLLRTAYAQFSAYCDRVGANTSKWDLGRICVTDLALIVCGLAEAAAFPEIPEKVTINEYVEISKFYSTPESRGFVNGILDKLIKEK